MSRTDCTMGRFASRGFRCPDSVTRRLQRFIMGRVELSQLTVSPRPLRLCAAGFFGVICAGVSFAQNLTVLSVDPPARTLTAARLNRMAPARVIAKAQRAIDRADVMISALPGVLAG